MMSRTNSSYGSRWVMDLWLFQEKVKGTILKNEGPIPRTIQHK